MSVCMHLYLIFYCKCAWKCKWLNGSFVSLNRWTDGLVLTYTLWRLFQLLSKGIVFRSGIQTGAPTTRKQLSLTIDSALAQKLSPNARVVVWYITSRGEIVSDSLDFTVNGAFTNEVNNCTLNAFNSFNSLIWLLLWFNRKHYFEVGYGWKTFLWHRYVTE